MNRGLMTMIASMLSVGHSSGAFTIPSGNKGRSRKSTKLNNPRKQYRNTPIGVRERAVSVHKFKGVA